MKTPENVVLVHDWLNGMRGGEKVLQAITEVFPLAKIFTLVLEKEKISPQLRQKQIIPSFIQKMPFGKSKYRHYLPLFPRAIEKFDLADFDLVISTSHCVAKGVKVPPDTLHICYCFSPMRYAWLFYEDYFGENKIKKIVYKPILNKLRKWDFESCSRVHHFLAISRNVADRIKKYYRRESEVIYPPIDTDFFTPSPAEEDFYLIVSALVPYKKIDIAIQAFNSMKLPLRIIGQGPEFKKLKSIASGWITFYGWLSDEEVRENYRRCKALIFPGEEDFGLTPVEAQACGKPVIAYRKGGVLESVIDGKTGLFFCEHTKQSLIDAVKKFQSLSFDKETIRKNSLRFNHEAFKANFKKYVVDKYNQFYLDKP